MGSPVEAMPAIILPYILTLPQSGPELYFLQAGQDLESQTRAKHPQMALDLDREYARAKQAFTTDPNHSNLERLRSAIGFSGGFNFIDNMEAKRWDGSQDKQLFQMKLGPSAAIQALKIANVQPEDKVVELFSGAGYFTFFLALSRPNELLCVDLFTPQMYDLGLTLDTAYEELFSQLPDEVKPPFTRPTFVQADCTNLPFFDKSYDKVFLHPPFGRESRKIVDLSETQAFVLWLRSLLSVNRSNTGPMRTFSLVPSEWTDTAGEIRQGIDFEKVIEGLEERLRNNPYFRPNGLSQDIQITPEDLDELRTVLDNSCVDQIKSRRTAISLLTTIKE